MTRLPSRTATSRQAAARVAVLYLVFAVLWIYASDRILALLIQDKDLLVRMATVKGVFYVVVTTGLLYMLLLYWNKGSVAEDEPPLLSKPRGLIVAFLALAMVVPLLAYIIIHTEGPRLQKKAQAELATIALLKSSQIEQWLAERRGDAEVLMDSEGFIDEADRWLHFGDRAAKVLIDRRLQAMKHVYDYRMELLDARESPDKFNPVQQAQFKAAQAMGRVQMGELYRDVTGQVWMDLMVPLIKHPGSQGAVGVVVMSAPIGEFLFPFIQTWPTPSPSAETLLIRKEGKNVLFLNELRHRRNTALAFRLPLDTPDLPSAIAARNGDKPQTIAGRDYRGIPVIATARPVKGTNWFLLAKVDREEVLSPLNQLLTWVIAVSLVAVAAVAAGVIMLWNQQQRAYRLELAAQTAEQDRLLRLFYDLPFIGMAIISPTTRRWMHVNDRLCGILGFSREELLNTSWEKLTYPDDLAANRMLYQRVMAGETDSYQMDKRFVRRDSSVVDTSLDVKCIRQKDGKVALLVATVQDITERKQAEQALRVSEQRLSGLVGSAMDAIIAINNDQRIVLFNPAAEKMFGLKAGDVLGQPLDRLLPQVFRQTHAEHIRAFGRTGVTSRGMGALGPISGLRANGEEFPIEASISQIEIMGGKLYTVILRDITERKRAEEALRASEERYRTLVEQSADGIFVSDAQGRYIDVNTSGCRMLGYTREELLTLDIADVITPDEIPRIGPEVARFAGGAVVTSEWQFRRKDGSTFPGEIQGRQLPDGRLQAILRDISERKIAEAALRDREEDFNRAQAVGHIGSWRLDVRRNELTWSVENHRIFEVPEATPMTYEFFLSTVHPDDRAYVDREWQAGLRGEPYDIEHRLLVNGKVKWVREKAELEFDAHGSLLGGFGTTQDITDIKQAHLSLQEADRRKDEFLALLAHELRNPMAVMTTAVYLLQNKGLEDPRMCRWATTAISTQTEQLKHLVDDLLDVARIGRGKIILKKIPLDVVRLITQAEQTCLPHMEQRLQHLTLNLPSKPLWIEADPARLTQVITNLLENSVKFTPKNGSIELSLRPEEGEAVICVRDTGRGITPDLLPHIFDTFTQGEVSLARDAGGLGLGLALVKSLVELHGGRVHAASEGAGKGAEFTVRLPALDDFHPDTAAEGTIKADGEKIGKRRILIAEDNAAAADSLATALRLSGHSVRVTQDGAAALATAEAEFPEIAILDIGLPEMDGYALARSLRQLPGGKQMLLIALTGYGQDDDRNRSQAAGFDYHLVKPADVEQLLGMINAWAPLGHA